MREQQQDELPRGGEGVGGQGAACLTNGNGLLHRKEEQGGGGCLCLLCMKFT